MSKACETTIRCLGMKCMGHTCVVILFLSFRELLCYKLCPNSSVAFGPFPVHFSGLCHIPGLFFPRVVPERDGSAARSCSPDTPWELPGSGRGLGTSLWDCGKAAQPHKGGRARCYWYACHSLVVLLYPHSTLLLMVNGF